MKILSIILLPLILTGCYMNEYVYTPNTYYTNPYSVKSYSYVNETYPVYAYDTTPTYCNRPRVIVPEPWNCPPQVPYYRSNNNYYQHPRTNYYRSYNCEPVHQGKKHHHKKDKDNH